MPVVKADTSQSSGLTPEPLVLTPLLEALLPVVAFCIAFFVGRPMFQPHPLNVLTTFGKIAAVRGTRMKMKLL